MEIKHIEKGSPDYPEVFKNYERMPQELYFIGNLPDPQLPSAAIVGARACSAYGRGEALKFARALSENGVQIISGMAIGIDSYAHEGALLGTTPTFAVLGCGVDICYPPSNSKLYDRIIKGGGGIISEYPPGTPALSYHFPVRNRIISALSNVVLVVEAKKKSGSLITASYALEQNKQLFAIPGKNNEPLSAGCNGLIYQGALPAVSPEQMLSDMHLAPDGGRSVPSPVINPDEKLILKRLNGTEASIDELSRDCGISIARLFPMLTDLTLRGLVCELFPGHFTAN